MQGVLAGLEPDVVITDSLVEFDRELFSVDEMPEAEIRRLALDVAEQMAARLGKPRLVQAAAEARRAGS